VREGLGDVGLPDPDEAVQDHRLPGVKPAHRGQVPDLRGGQLRVGGEVEPLQRGALLEPGPAAGGRHGSLNSGGSSDLAVVYWRKSSKFMSVDE
jgi:hypothetical protein